MAFWGVEVKPSEPYIHRYNSEQGRLHISQATLGDGKSSKKCILKCAVGSQKQIYLCSLLPDKLETCALNIEFEEEEEVTLSVIGSHSVHLSGYFLGEYGGEDENDSDQFEGHGCGSDCDSEDSMDYVVEDDEDDFDSDDSDDDYEFAHVHPSGVKIEEIVDDEEEPAKDSDMLKPSKKKKHEVNGSNDGKNSEKQIIVKSSSQNPVVVESEDEDGFPISSPGKRKTEASTNNKGNDNKVEEVPGKKDAIDNGQTTSENSTKLGKRKKNKKNSDAEEKIPEAKDKNSSVQEADTGKVEQTNEKKKPKEKKKKKKNKKLKTENAPETTTDKSILTVDSETKDDDEASQVRTFANGLVIEEVAMGRPDGKKADSGKKVSVRYVGKLKKNGNIFDSNIGRAPFKFRLGIGQVIKGWDVGVKGMRVGDKRRLTIPPSMGYGAAGAPPAIPQNAWLVFDVELVDVA